jgi:hypothetical protein
MQLLRAAWTELYQEAPHRDPNIELLWYEPAFWYFPEAPCLWIPASVPKDAPDFVSQLSQLHTEEPIRVFWSKNRCRFVEGVPPELHELARRVKDKVWFLPTPSNIQDKTDADLEEERVGTPGVAWYTDPRSLRSDLKASRNALKSRFTKRKNQLKRLEVKPTPKAKAKRRRLRYPSQVGETGEETSDPQSSDPEIGETSKLRKAKKVRTI